MFKYYLLLSIFPAASCLATYQPEEEDIHCNGYKSQASPQQTVLNDAIKALEVHLVHWECTNTQWYKKWQEIKSSKLGKEIQSIFTYFCEKDIKCDDNRDLLWFLYHFNALLKNEKKETFNKEHEGNFERLNRYYLSNGVKNFDFTPWKTKIEILKIIEDLGLSAKAIKKWETKEDLFDIVTELNITIQEMNDIPALANDLKQLFFLKDEKKRDLTYKKFYEISESYKNYKANGNYELPGCVRI